ncbi:polysaccharide biosynthesis protein [Pontimicrobium aquaticum]|uniref:Polysaccharide biosynthesis protein n=1 Tax=Pontimicrobium aquaticum TaxID=2565367 RepID=A0A4V5LQ17_9FLAO|nr:nucleoside-diphosphate sugar epimerase/dehydratase [Pontimicrobium aquaticum]TJY33439.1 polysaccharide biosynthesis protein [Pontimicrobium aquaticum]
MFKNGLYNISQRYASKWLVLLFDVCIVLFTFFLAYLIRYNFRLDFEIKKFFGEIPFVALNAIISFLIVGTHKSVVRFIGIKDVINVIIGVNILATILLVVTFLTRQFDFFISYDIPGSIIYIHLLLNILLLISSKFFIKASYKAIISGFKSKVNVLIYGAGNSGNLTYDAIINDANSDYEVIGFIDDDERKIGKKINLLKVYGSNEINDNFIEKHKVHEVIISIQSISYHRLLEISSIFLEKSIKVKIVPPVQQWIDGDLQASQIKEVKIEDLLGREPISFENPVLVEEYDNKVILISGAAGSIGSEIARNLCNFNFKKLILVDMAESALYDIQQEFVQKDIKNYVALVTDVRCQIRMDKILSDYRPEIIFHAAAYKHVPLMENNPQEAVSINIGGTINISNLAVKHGVDKFVMISTDKAVNPTNVMGATKRVAELYISCLKGKGKTKFITTRFGNVLGSNGSVIPLFKKQIENGGPLTVTHRDITRYFMTIPEACSLVLEAAAMGNGGEIFVFDMGQSVKIFDLAINMIKLSGLKYPEDIDIKIVGLRPGEKIYEELLADGENTKQTYHEKIMIAKSKKISVEDIQEKIIELNNSNLNSQSIEIVSKLKNIVPEYISNNSKFEVLDKAKN